MLPNTAAIAAYKCRHGFDESISSSHNIGQDRDWRKQSGNCLKIQFDAVEIACRDIGTCAASSLVHEVGSQAASQAMASRSKVSVSHGEARQT